MKWNWGTGIVVAIVGFIGFILYFVITMSTDSKYRHDLVTEEYYAKEMLYQQEIDAETNTTLLDAPITGSKTSEGWVLVFPTSVAPAKVQGTVSLYRPSNEKLDFELPLELIDHKLLIPDARLLDGRWNITISWTYDDKPFMYKKSIVY